jgi:hypothetical protein
MMKLVKLLLEISCLAVEYHDDVITRLLAQGTHLFGVLGAGPQDTLDILQQNCILPPELSLDSDRNTMALNKELTLVILLTVF